MRMLSHTHVFAETRRGSASLRGGGRLSIPTPAVRVLHGKKSAILLVAPSRRSKCCGKDRVVMRPVACPTMSHTGVKGSFSFQQTPTVSSVHSGANWCRRPRSSGQWTVSCWSTEDHPHRLCSLDRWFGSRHGLRLNEEDRWYGESFESTGRGGDVCRRRRVK